MTSEITARLMAPFPREAIKQRQGGRGKMLDYVEGHSVIHRLIAATNNQFDLRVLSVDQKGDLMTALVELTIPGLGSRQHMGVQKVAPNAGEDLVKGAITDALKKAATLFGVGLELYGPDYEADERQASPAYERVLDEVWRMAEDGKPHDAIRDHLNANRHGMTPEQRQLAKLELAKITERFYPPTSIAG